MENGPHNDTTMFGTTLPNPPSAKQQSWGAVLSIIIIVLMIIVGAYYSWSKRTAQQNTMGDTASEATTNL